VPPITHTTTTTTRPPTTATAAPPAATTTTTRPATTTTATSPVATTTTTTRPPTTTSTTVRTSSTTTTTTQSSSTIGTVFLIVMENTDWSSIKGSSSAPYINGTLLRTAAHAEQYYNPPNMHPSLPNYLWLEAGTNFGILDDNDPSSNHQNTTSHLVDMLENSGISWKAYQEDEGSGAWDGSSCPSGNPGNSYDVNHNPFVYFTDITNNATRCHDHVGPYSAFATELASNTGRRYSFIIPDRCHDVHGLTRTVRQLPVDSARARDMGEDRRRSTSRAAAGPVMRSASLGIKIAQDPPAGDGPASVSPVPDSPTSAPVAAATVSGGSRRRSIAMISAPSAAEARCCAPPMPSRHPTPEPPSRQE